MNPKFIYGTVNADGTISSDSKLFSVTNERNGDYVIKFEPFFHATPTVVATQNFPGGSDLAIGGGNPLDNAVVVAVNANGAKIRTGNSNGTVTNRSFSFIAMGE